MSWDRLHGMATSPQHAENAVRKRRSMHAPSSSSPTVCRGSSLALERLSVGLRGKSLVPRGGNDSQAGVVCRRKVDACPAGNVSHRGDQPRVPGCRPGRQQCVGLRLIQPGGKIMEGMAGKENGDAVGVHAAEFTESGKWKMESPEGPARRDHSGAGIGGSSRSCLHAKHGILPFSLGKRSLLVLRFASCEAVFDGAGIGGSSRSIGRILALATRLLPSRRRVPCDRHPSARASPTPGQVKNLPPRGAGDGTRLTPLAHHS